MGAAGWESRAGWQKKWPKALGVSKHLGQAWPRWTFVLEWSGSRLQHEAPKTTGSTRGGAGEMLSLGPRSCGTPGTHTETPRLPLDTPRQGGAAQSRQHRGGLTRCEADGGIFGMGTLGDRDALCPASTGMDRGRWRGDRLGQGSSGTGILRDKGCVGQDPLGGGFLGTRMLGAGDRGGGRSEQLRPLRSAVPRGGPSGRVTWLTWPR